MEYVITVGDIAIIVAIGIGGLLLKHYLPSYLTEKGKNLATKEDVEEITRKVEGVKTQYQSEVEKLKAELQKEVEKVRAQHTIDTEKLKSDLQKESEVVVRQRKVYEEIAESMGVFISGRASTSTEAQKQRFLTAYATAWLWASDTVVQALNEFLIGLEKHTAGDRSVNQSNLQRTYSNCIVAMRKDSGSKDTSLGGSAYRIVSFG